MEDIDRDKSLGMDMCLLARMNENREFENSFDEICPGELVSRNKNTNGHVKSSFYPIITIKERQFSG